jgi:serine/threonine-protein kinase
MNFCPTCARRRTRDGSCGCATAARPPVRTPQAVPPAPPPHLPAPVDVREELRRSQANRTLALVAVAVALVVGVAVAIPAMVREYGSDPLGTAAATEYYPGVTIETPQDTDTGFVPDTEPVFPDTTETAPDFPTETTVDPTVGVTPDPSADPATELATLAAADLPGLRESLNGSWLPQLSSKRVGMTVRGTHYDEAAILADHLALRSAYPDARLVWSGDWVTFSAPDFWVTMLAEPFAAAAGANGWCDAQGIGRDDCFAKRLSTVGPGDGNTVPR